MLSDLLCGIRSCSLAICTGKPSLLHVVNMAEMIQVFEIYNHRVASGEWLLVGTIT
jgi:hypothetical protein